MKLSKLNLTMAAYAVASLALLAANSGLGFKLA